MQRYVRFGGRDSRCPHAAKRRRGREKIPCHVPCPDPAYKSSFRWGDALPLIPFGLAGAVIGGLLMKKIPNTLLKRIFGVILIISGGRLLLQ